MRKSRCLKVFSRCCAVVVKLVCVCKTSGNNHFSIGNVLNSIRKIQSDFDFKLKHILICAQYSAYRMSEMYMWYVLCVCCVCDLSGIKSHMRFVIITKQPNIVQIYTFSTHEINSRGCSLLYTCVCLCICTYRSGCMMYLPICIWS